jgi:tetratricopeptide (TPR) repeat protein
MEQLDFSKILEKIGPDKDLTKLNEEELLFYDMVRAIQSRSADDEKQIIQQVLKQFKNQQFIVKTNENRINMKSTNKIWIGIAAGVAILVVAYFFLSKPSVSTDELFSANFKPSKEFVAKSKDKAMSYGMASTGTESRDSFLKALALYESNEYDQAMKILGPYVESYPTDNEARFHLSMCQIYREKYAPALVNLSKLNEVSKDLDPNLAEEIKYDLALCYLKMNDGKKQAKILFEQLVSMDGKHAKTAKGILEMMK